MIDRGLSKPWPKQVVKAAAPFRQGTLISSPPLFYYADARHPIWELTRVAQADGEDGKVLLDLHADYRPPFGIITSQTCDVGEEAAEPEFPWLQVAPVYPVDPDDSLLKRAYTVRLSGKDLPSGTFVADLRIEVPVEKSDLVGRQPVEGFETEAEYIDFAEVLGRRRQRAALASVLNDVIRGTLQKRRDNNRKRFRAVQPHIYKMKLEIEGGTRLAPTAAKIYIISHYPLDQDTKKWLESWWDLAHAKAKDAGLNLLANGYMSGRDIDLILYDNLIELDLRPLIELGPPPAGSITPDSA